jgi:hypothetical protein
MPQQLTLAISRQVTPKMKNFLKVSSKKPPFLPWFGEDSLSFAARKLTSLIRLLLIPVLISLTSISVAQNTTDDSGPDPSAYDPFSDYSEFQQTAEEEADIYFFRNGRLVTANLALGYRGFSDVLGKLYRADTTYGLALTYFFDLRFATYISFLTGDYEYRLTTPNGVTTGNLSMSFLSLGSKYYLNTEILVWPLSDLNPHVLIGMNQTYRTLTLSQFPDAAKDNTLGLEIGAGFELLTLKKQAFVGVQWIYRYFQFADENQNLIDPVTLLPIDVKPRGDSFDILLNLGLNF